MVCSNHVLHPIFPQVKPDDAFGEVMVRNLEERCCPLLGIHSVPSVAAQEQRFTQSGWDGARAWTMLAIYNSIDPADKVFVNACALASVCGCALRKGAVCACAAR